jgi:hypothetical protein
MGQPEDQEMAVIESVRKSPMDEAKFDAHILKRLAMYMNSSI